MSSQSNASDPSLFRQSIRAIAEAHPLRTPWHYDQNLTSPRPDRLDAKTAYFVEYIQYLEQRIASLEDRLDGR
ncbi:hypothetical protein [Herbiconiux sp. YIM B11900]|uniref:hypothetical protein n=1 Tax=Herbiconiux sp. YIM B11900 TaxID=3404131 RepID=UPI003F87D44F